MNRRFIEAHAPRALLFGFSENAFSRSSAVAMYGIRRHGHHSRQTRYSPLRQEILFKFDLFTHTLSASVLK